MSLEADDLRDSRLGYRVGDGSERFGAAPPVTMQATGTKRAPIFSRRAHWEFSSSHTQQASPVGITVAALRRRRAASIQAPHRTVPHRLRWKSIPPRSSTGGSPRRPTG